MLQDLETIYSNMSYGKTSFVVLIPGVKLASSELRASCTLSLLAHECDEVWEGVVAILVILARAVWAARVNGRRVVGRGRTKCSVMGKACGDQNVIYYKVRGEESLFYNVHMLFPGLTGLSG